MSQILSLFGVAPVLNFYVWTVGVFSGIGMLNTVYGVMTLMHYDEAWEVRNDDDDKFTAK